MREGQRGLVRSTDFSPARGSSDGVAAQLERMRPGGRALRVFPDAGPASPHLKAGDELHEAVRRGVIEGERLADDVRWIRSYVIAETDGSLGTVCVFEASSPEAIRRHAYASAWPVDEIVAVADTLVVRPDPSPAVAA